MAADVVERPQDTLLVPYQDYGDARHVDQAEVAAILHFAFVADKIPHLSKDSLLLFIKNSLVCVDTIIYVVCLRNSGYQLG